MESKNVDQIVSALTCSFPNLRIVSSKRIHVYVEYDRMQAIDFIHKSFENSSYERNSKLSSVGHIQIQDIAVAVKPLNKQGYNSAGIQNENFFIETIDKHITQGISSIHFMSPFRNFVITNPLSIVRSCSQKDRTDKSDMVIQTEDRSFYLSLKKDNAEIWESADSYWGEKAKERIAQLSSENKISLNYDGYVHTITPNVAIKASQRETYDVVFGSYVNAVIQRTFLPSDFKISDSKLYITVSNVLRKVDDIVSENEVYFLIRNDRTRNCQKIGLPGIRVLAVYKKRLSDRLLIIE